MIDTHCHILPGVDDGPASVGASLEIAAQAIADGIDTIVATPHIIEGLYDGSDLPQRVAGLQQKIDEHGIKLRLVAGAEIPMSYCISADADVLKRLSMGDSKYLLMETAQVSYEQINQAIYNVRLKGLIPVLAHPERVAIVQKNPEQLAAKVESGDVICQLTAAGIEGAFGKTVKKTAMALVKLGAAHLVASDSHTVAQRAPRLSVSRRIISDAFGEDAARTIFELNPARLLEDLPLPPAMTVKNLKSKKGLLARILRKV